MLSQLCSNCRKDPRAFRTAQIDQGIAGTVSQAITLDNQLKRVYLPLIRR